MFRNLRPAVCATAKTCGVALVYLIVGLVAIVAVTACLGPDAVLDWSHSFKANHPTFNFILNCISDAAMLVVAVGLWLIFFDGCRRNYLRKLSARLNRAA